MDAIIVAHHALQWIYPLGGYFFTLLSYEEVYMAATWDSLHKQACAALQTQAQDAVVTYDEVFHPPDLFIMYVKMDHPGWSEKEIVAEARKRYNAHFGIGEGGNGQTKTG